MRLSALIPTTGRRPALLAQVLHALHEQFRPDELQVLMVSGLSWGAGLNELAKHATGEYWACMCDDTVPHPGWLEAGVSMLAGNVQPSSRYLHPDGSPLRPGTDDAPHGSNVAWCRSFLLTRYLYGQVGPFIDATWYADIDYSERLIRYGMPILACDGYSFTHLDGDRDWLTGEEAARQLFEYEESHRRQGIEVFR